MDSHKNTAPKIRSHNIGGQAGIRTRLRELGSAGLIPGMVKSSW